MKKLEGKVAIITGASRGVGEYMALELAKNNKLDTGTLIRAAFKDEEMKTRSKLVPKYARDIVDDVIKLSDRDTDMRLMMGQLNEVSLLQDAIRFIENTYKTEVAVCAESDPWIEDPAKRAGRAKPYRPAIFVE